VTERKAEGKIKGDGTVCVAKGCLHRGKRGAFRKHRGAVGQDKCRAMTRIVRAVHD
jgi:hypothetical protein